VVAKDQPLRVLQLTELDRETPVFSSLQEALKALEVPASSNSDAEV
jgi:hypothetical protein